MNAKTAQTKVNGLIKDACMRQYNKGGLSAVIEFCDRKDIGTPNEYCNACDNVVPQIEHECLVCGQPTVKTKK